MSYTSTYLVHHYRDMQAQAQQLQHLWTQTAASLREHLEALAPQAEAARLELARAYLPTLAAESIAEAERLTGFRGFSRRNPLEAMAHEAHVLANTVQQIAASEPYQRRRYLVGPHGELSRALAEAEELLAPWEEECHRFEDLSGFDELIEVSYDTPEFDVSFIEPRYWRLWAAGDRICEQLGAADFGDDVLPEWRRVSAERARWRGQVAEAKAKVDAIHDLVQRHDRAQARLPKLPEIYLAGCQGMVAEFLEHADLPLLSEWLKRDAPDRRDLLMALRRVAGLAAKQRFLTELLEDGALPAIQDLKARQARYRQKEAKYQRSKNQYRTFYERDMDLKFAGKRDKLAERAEQAAGLAERMMRYSDYERFDLDNDPELWWLEFTGAKPPRTAPDLRRWWDRQRVKPSVRLDRPQEAREQSRRVAKARRQGFEETGSLYVS
ncbi:MAG: hypothetical protein H6741_30895 [Alphaproteobacteria bacterium]|nr:hypothetical protein [Alphaproteobacteria bacterium]